MLNNFLTAIKSSQYTCHLNWILYKICYYLPVFGNDKSKLHANLNGLKRTIELFNRLAPDISKNQ